MIASALRAKAGQGGPLKKLIILAALAAIVAAYFLFDLGQYLTLEGIKQALNFARLYLHPTKSNALPGSIRLQPAW